ncbi:extracellular solute-binding protein [Saccharopolyspora erythraea]|uniref:ABC transporter substrate-binding protein n=1 Tax=Saccharopolyspora erythraea TaxID=1836 RepID=UPI001BA509DD|nr:extracellular solute-binding protein [Saccharopolyspora erythraea]QUH03905.1 extracellular solute-binding protein [Saccharopolyspora erythraea]
MRRSTGTVIGAAAVALATLAACAPGTDFGPASNGSPPGHLTYAYFTDGPDEKVTRDLIAEFERRTGATVDLQILPYSELEQQLQGRLAAGHAPDIARLTNLSPFRSDLLNLSANGADIGDQFLDQARETTSGPAGETVAVASDLTMNGPLVNTDLFARAGVALPPKDRPVSWPELLAKAREVQQKSGSPYAIAFDKSGARVAGLYNQFGTNYFGTDGAVQLDPAKAAAATRLFVDLNNDGTMYRDFWVQSGTKYEGADDMFLREDVPVYFSGNWQMGQFDQEARFGWTVLPNPCAERCGGFPGGKFMVALRQTTNPRLAAEFVAFMNSRQAQEKYAEKAHFLPTRKDLLAEGVDYPRRDAEMDVFLDDVRRTDPAAFSSAYSPGMDSTADAVVDELAAAIVGRQSVPETVARMRTSAQEALEASIP